MPRGRPAESHDGTEHRPFGCTHMPRTSHYPRHVTDLRADDLSIINGIGLPQFESYHLPNPQPPSQQILNNTENSQLDDFFTSFDTLQPHVPDGELSHGFSMDHFGTSGAFMGMPPNFVGSESVLMNGSGQEVHEWQMDRFMFGNDLPHFDVHSNPALQHSAFGPISQSGPSTAPLAPVYSSSYQQQPFQPQGQPLQTPGRGPVPNFGSDTHFQPSGFNHRLDQANSNPIQDEAWLSSNPNTRPSTQPSSPNLNRKRKSEADHTSQRNGFLPSSRPHSPNQTSARHSRVSHVKAEPAQEPTPYSSLDNNSHLSADSDADAGAESDVEYPSRTQSPPAPWPANRPRPAKATTTASTRTKKKIPAPKQNKAPPKGSSARPKAAQRNSSGQQPRRQPLSLDQKKANHTNSEQRRRDATARAQARLFDLVPDVRNISQKQSTVQKLVKVVEYVPAIEGIMSGMRDILGPNATAFGGPEGASSSRKVAIPDAVDAAAAGALAGMGALDGALMFDNTGALDGTGF